jgi:hypothetical protein
VQPGPYYLRTNAQTTGRLAGAKEVFADQYYGGARESKDASLVRVRAGDNLAGLDFRLSLEPSVSVHGWVTGVPEEPVVQTPQAQQQSNPPVPVFGAFFAPGGARTGTRETLVTISPVAERITGNWSRITEGSEHRFEFPDLPPGRYRIEAVYRSPDRTYGASQTLDLHAGSGDVVLALTPSVDLHGTLQTEGDPGQTKFRIQLRRPETTTEPPVTAEVGADGTFTLKQVLDGEWELSVLLPNPGFLKSARLGDKDVRLTRFRAAPDAALKIVVSMRTATLEGELEPGSSGRAGFVIAPVKGPLHDISRYYHAGAVDDAGKFKIAGLEPGKYRIFVLGRTAASINFQSPEAVDQLYDLGQEVDLPEGGTVHVKTKLIPPEVAIKAVE